MGLSENARLLPGRPIVQAVGAHRPPRPPREHHRSGYIRNVFNKLGLHPGEREHRRVPAVLQFLRQQLATTASRVGIQTACAGRPSTWKRKVASFSG